MADKKYMAIQDVRCPICNGPINDKWLSFRGSDVVEFVAECWPGDIQETNKPRHIFYFQIEVPDCVLVCDKDSKVFDDEVG